MANPTNPFSWQMPTASDLVTDLPADFEVFGQAVATSMADLLGGTTGQILAKASDANMDFTWIANDQGDITGVTASSPLTGGGTSGALTIGILSGTTSNLGAVQLSDSTSSTSTTLAATANAVKTTYDLANGAIPKSLIDAAGDLIIGTADNTAGRIAIGTNGQVLQSNGTTATWVTPSASSSALVYVGQGTFSGGTSATLDNVFTSTYRNYLMFFDYTGTTPGSEVRVTFRSGGTDNTTANYYSNITYGAGGTVGSATASGGTTAKIGGGTTTGGGLVSATFYAPQATDQSRIESRGHKGVGADAEVHVYNAGFNGTTSFDGIKLSTATGTMTGTFRIYGIANS